MRDLQIDVAPVHRWRSGVEACAQPVASEEPIRVWTRDSFRLELFDTGRTDHLGKSRLAYRFFDSRMGARPIFQGADFCASPLHAIDSDATVAGLLSFLSLEAGDTDAEHFADYTPRQLDWRDTYAEELGFLRFEIEESIAQAQQEGGGWDSLALYVELTDDGTMDTVFSVFDCMTGERWEERFSDVERDDSGPTTEALAYVRELVEESASERREVAS